MNVFDQQVIEQQKWKLRPGLPRRQVFDKLLTNEFLNQVEQNNVLVHRLSNFITYAVHAVPFYKERKAQYNYDFSNFSISSLQYFPVLDRNDVQENKDALITRSLPPNLKIGGVLKTSGSTGQPVEVLHTLESIRFFSALKQREYRNWGIDPSKTLISIRPSVDLPEVNGERLADGQFLKHDSWLNVGDKFKTGPMYYLPDTTEITSIAEYLNKLKPGYLLCMAAILEHLAISYSHIENRSGLSGALSISQQLTQGMRELSEKYVAPNIYQNYGMNEVGLIAMRCPLSGYYHVHNECAVVEIVDENGTHCEPGVSGKLLVTSINNYAMPLIRYDTDDLAEIPIDNCPCGRTLQTFTNIRGRYRRTAHLPAGTWDYWEKLLDIFGAAPPEEMSAIKQYQLRQFDEQTYQLKLKANGKVANSLKDKIYLAWKSGVVIGESATISILELDEIESSGKKFQNFISDIAPPE